GGGAAGAGGGRGWVVPLEHAFGVREGAVLLDDRGSRQEEDLGRDRLRVYTVWIRVPVAGALGLEEITDHQPVEPPHRVAVQSSIRASRRWVLSHEEGPADLAPMHLAEVAHLREVLVELGEPHVSVAVLGGGRPAAPGFPGA